MTQQHIAIEQVTPHIGAYVNNIDLTQDLNDMEVAIIHDALQKYLVLFFQDQRISSEDQLRFARRLGELESHPFVGHVDQHPELLLLRNDREHPPQVNRWHTDVTFQELPAKGAVLRAYEVPDIGGDTLWASMYAAYEALSDGMQHFLSGLTAIHDFEHVFFGKDGYGVGGQMSPQERAAKIAEGRKRWPLTEHPVIRTHPETGRQALYVNSIFTVSISGMKERESRALLDMLYQHIALPEFQVRFKWRRNSIAVWDNRCTQHYALADYWPQVRVMHRATLSETERPFHSPNYRAPDSTIPAGQKQLAG